MAELRLKSTGTIKLFESDNTSSVTIASPASLGGDRTITLPDASVTLASGTMLATDGSGASLTALNATQLGSGTVPTARLGSGTASSSTVLYGDQTYKTEPGGGKVLQVVYSVYSTETTSTGTATTSFIDTGATAQITTSATNSKVLCIVSQVGDMAKNSTDENAGMGVKLLKDLDSAGYADVDVLMNYWGYGVAVAGTWRMGTLTYSHLTGTVSSSGTVVDFKTQFNLYNESGSSCTASAQKDSDPTTFVLFEVGA